MRNEYPQYTLKRRGSEAILVTQKGYPDQVFDLAGLWKEYRRVSYPNIPDPWRRYVIERAIEHFKNKSPQDWRRRGSAKIAGRWVDRWAAAPARYQSRKRAPARRSRSLFRRIWERIFGV